MPMKLGIVIPVYGNEKSLAILHERITRSLQGLEVDWSIIFVNDRSPDNSQAVLEELARTDPRVKVILLSKNHGSFVAIIAGLNHAKDNDAIAILAADLQDPPELLPEMVKKWREGNPVVLCVRRERSDSFGTKFFSSMFNRLYRRFVMPDMPKGGFDFCLIDRKVVNVVIESSEKNTSLVGLIIWAGFERAYIPYDRAERLHGKSMWSFRKKIRYAINSVISFSSLPLKLFGFLGVTLSVICVLAIIVTLINYFRGAIPVSGWTSLILLILTVAAFQFLAFGILGEYFWNNLEQSRKRPLFIVDRQIDNAARQADAYTPSADFVPFFDLKIVSSAVAPSLEQSAVKVIGSPQVILGSEVERFEKELAAYVGMKYSVGVANGTDAITLALWACGIKEGDKVVTTALSAPATVVAIIRAGAIPCLVDVDERYLTIDPDKVEDAVNRENARAIVPVHLYGNPCDMDRLVSIAEKYNLVIIEDCAQSFGSTISGVHCGNFSKAAAFSFYPTKNLGAYGDGGAVITDDPAVADQLKMTRFYGQNEFGECVLQGINSRLDELQAALLSERLKVVDLHNRQRVKIMQKYNEALALLNPVPTKQGGIPHLYVLRPNDRDRFRKFLLENKIHTGMHYPLSLNLHSYFKKHCIFNNCSIAENASRHVVSLPCFPGMGDDTVGQIIKTCRRWKD